MSRRLMPPSRTRSSRARGATLVLAAVVVLGACTQGRSVPDSYGDTTESNFTEGCEVALTADDGQGVALSADDAASVCGCSYEEISDPDTGIPYEDFKEINDQLEEEPGPLPETFQRLIADCQERVLS